MDTTAPTVTAQASGTTGTINLSAVAADNKQVAKVAYYIDGTLVGTAVAGAPWTRAFNTLTLTNGSHSLVARAYDFAGNQTDSAPVALDVAN